MPECEIIIYWNKANRIRIGEVPELPGCMADGAIRQLAESPGKCRSCHPGVD